MSDTGFTDDGDESTVSVQETVIDTRREPSVAQWTSQSDALRIFATSDELTQSSRHIKPLHWYIASRLVVEGGFHPDDITPKPPFTVQKRRNEYMLAYDPTAAGGGEATILGGLKTKNVDVVVNRAGIGPTMAVSCKGMTGALRNLTNRMEETIGEVTNLHITYPALVFGYVFLLRANRTLEDVAGEAAEVAEDEVAAVRPELQPNDMALSEDGSPVEALLRFDNALRGMNGRRSIRDDISRYEAVTLVLVDTAETKTPGRILPEFPPLDSAIRIERFFATLYARYDERFVFAAPKLGKVTRRLNWSFKSPAFAPNVLPSALDYEPRTESLG